MSSKKKPKKTAGLLKSYFHLLLQVIITNEVLYRSYKLTCLFRNNSVIPQPIRKGVLIRQITLSRFCTAVGGQQFRIDSRNFKQKLRLNVIIPFSVIVLSLRDAPKNYFE